MNYDNAPRAGAARIIGPCAMGSDEGGRKAVHPKLGTSADFRRLEALGPDPRQPYQVHGHLSNARYLWYGPRNRVEINPHVVPAHIFQVRRCVRTEGDFEYYQ